MFHVLVVAIVERCVSLQSCCKICQVHGQVTQAQVELVANLYESILCHCALVADVVSGSDMFVVVPGLEETVFHTDHQEDGNRGGGKVWISYMAESL